MYVSLILHAEGVFGGSLSQAAIVVKPRCRLELRYIHFQGGSSEGVLFWQYLVDTHILILGPQSKKPSLDRF